MRHAYFGKKLSRTKNERKQLLRNLACDVFKRGSINTTKAKAVAVRPMVEKMITKAKKGGQFAYREVLATLGNADVTKQLMEDAKTRFSNRSSGYTRIVKFGLSGKDARDLVAFSLVDARVEQQVITPKKSETPKKEEKKQEEKPKQKKTAPVKKQTIKK